MVNKNNEENTKQEIQECVSYLKKHLINSEDIEQLMKYMGNIEIQYQSLLSEFTELKNNIDLLQEGKYKRLLKQAAGAVDTRIGELKQQVKHLSAETLYYLKQQVNYCKLKISAKAIDTIGLTEKLGNLNKTLEKVSNSIAGFTCQFYKAVGDTRVAKKSIKKLIGMKPQKEDSVKLNVVQKLLISASIHVIGMQNYTENAVRRLNNIQRKSVLEKLKYTQTNQMSTKQKPQKIHERG